MRVLLCSELFLPHIGGAEVLTANFITAMQKRGHEFLILTSHSARDLPDFETYHGIPVHRFNFHRSLAEQDLQQINQIRKKISEIRSSFKPDLVHLNNIAPDTFFHLQTSFAYPAPTYIVLHGLPELKDLKSGTLFNKTLNSADWIVAVSNQMLEKVRDLLPDITQKSSAIPNSLEMPPIKPKPLETNPPQILAIGRLFNLKGFDLALKAFSKIHQLIPNTNMVIAGDGPVRTELELLTKELQLENRVTYLGWVKPEKALDLFNNSTVIVMPSRSESFGLVSLQAAQMARPIVASKVGELPEIIDDGRTGFLVESEDVQGFAEKLLFLLQNPEAAEEMGQAARKRAIEKFSWENFLDQYEVLYDQLARTQLRRKSLASL